jgi:hypothetical protein
MKILHWTSSGCVELDIKMNQKSEYVFIHIGPLSGCISKIFYITEKHWSEPTDFPSKMVSCRFSLDLPLLALDSHLKAVGPIYGSHP